MSLEENPAQAGRRIAIPGFAELIIIASGIHSLHLLPEAAVCKIVEADTFLQAMAMGALGLRTHIGAIRQAGPMPLLLAGLLYVFLMAGGYLINRMVTMLF